MYVQIPKRGVVSKICQRDMDDTYTDNLGTMQREPTHLDMDHGFILLHGHLVTTRQRERPSVCAPHSRPLTRRF